MSTTREKIKTVLICVLLIGMLYLTYAVWFYDSPFGELDLFDMFSISVSEQVGEGAGSDLERFGIRPLGVAVRTDGNLRGAVYDSDLSDAIYTKLREGISDSFKSHESLTAADSSVWENAMGKDGLFLDYRADVPVSAIKMWLGAGDSDEQISARYFILSTSGRDVSVYAKNSRSGEVFSARSEFSSESLKKLLSEVEATPLSFAASEEGELFKNIRKETLLAKNRTSAPTIAAYSLDTVLSAEAVQKLVDAFGLSDVKPSTYAEADGTQVYVADRVTLKISKGGIASYTDTRPQADETLGLLVEYDGEAPLLAEKAEAARKLCATLAALLPGDGGIYLSSVSRNGEEEEFVFARHVFGIPVDMRGTVYFAKVIIKNKSIVAAKVNLAGYTKTGKNAEIIPEKLAAAAMLGKDIDGDLNMRYEDKGEEIISPFWYIGGMETKGEEAE